MESHGRSSKRRRADGSASRTSPPSSPSDDRNHSEPSHRNPKASRSSAKQNYTSLRGHPSATSPSSPHPSPSVPSHDSINASSPSATSRPYSSTAPPSRYAAYSPYSGIGRHKSHGVSGSRRNESAHSPGAYATSQPAAHHGVAPQSFGTRGVFRDYSSSGTPNPIHTELRDETSRASQYSNSGSPQAPPPFDADSSAAMLEPGLKTENGTPSDKPRGGQACLECRLAKVRCLASTESDNCQRCHRFGFECLFVQHKRGRKPKSKLQGRDLTLLAEAASATPASAITRQRSESSLPTTRKLNADAITSQASPGVRWAPPPGPALAPSEPAYDADTVPLTDLDFDDALASPDVATLKGHPLYRQLSRAGNYDPENLHGVDVGRMTRAMQQAMRSLERRRGAPYTLVTNDAIPDEETKDEDIDDRDMVDGTSPSGPANAATTDTNAANESFELIAEQPLTLRVMLKPFEVNDEQESDAPRVVQDDRITVGAQLRELVMDDPVTTGILSESAARALFDLFMSHCNGWSELFDPALHSHEFVRKRSSFLYTVLLYVSSRYSRTPTAHHLIVRDQRGERIEPSEWDLAYPDRTSDRTQQAADAYARQVRRRLHSQARDHAARAFVDGDRTVLCCQAFFILASWKPLDDGLSVIQLGYAFRLAMDIQLHAEMPNCVSSSESLVDQKYEAVQRRFRNRQRTFMMLFIQDKSQQISNKISTHSISPDNVLIRRCQTWWKLQGAIPSDAFVCASADLRRIQAKYVDLYDRIEALTSSSSDGPSVMMPAFLNDLVEWSARWHDALDLKEDAEPNPDMANPIVYRRHCQCLCLKLWKNNIKTYISSWVLKSGLKQAAMLEHQEAVRNHHRRSTTRGTEDKDSIKSYPGSGLETGTVNLMAMPAFWPCVEGARGVLEAICAFPSERLLTTPDSTVMQTTHAAVLLCSLATVKSQPPLGPGYLRSNIQLIDRTSSAFRRASITEDDTVNYIAQYLESLLRPRNVAASGSRATQQPAEHYGQTRDQQGEARNLAEANTIGQFATGMNAVGGQFSSSEQFSGAGNMFDEAIAAATTSNHAAPMDISSVTWPTPVQSQAAAGNGNAGWSGNTPTPWTSFMFNSMPTAAPVPTQQQQQAQAADETLQMLLRFLDG